MFDYVEEHTMCPKCHLPELTPAVLAVIRCRSRGYSKNKKKGKKVKITKDQRKKSKTGRVKRKKNKRRHSIEDEEEDEEEKVSYEDEPKHNSNNEIQNRIAKDPIFSLHHFLKQHENASFDEITEKIKVLKLAHSLQRGDEIKMVVRVLMEYDKDHKAFIASIKKHKEIFQMFTMRNGDSKIFLATLEKLIALKMDLLEHSYSILNCLYDEDIADEEEILEWHSSVGNNNEAQLIRNKAKPFIKWLRNADHSHEI